MWRRSDRRLAGAMALAGALLLSVAPAAATARSTGSLETPVSDPVVLTLFHGDGCPHCDRAESFLGELHERWPDLVIETFEVWNDADNLAHFSSVMASLGEEAQAVPTIIVGDRVWVGFTDPIGDQIDAVVAALLTGDAASAPTGPSTIVEVPIVGEVDVGDRSMVLATLLIGFVDGVNPCSLWVLSMLLALVLHSGSRARVLLVGSVFLVVTSTLYGVYMIGAYSALDYAGGIGWIRAMVALVAGVFGVLHLKEYVTHRGLSLTIPDARKPKMYARMRELARADRPLPTVLAGTTVLAIGVSLLETPCTAGLPLLWTDLLSARDVPTSGAALLFALYLAVFLLDEVIIFSVAVVTLRATKLQEQHGRALQLVSGTLMVSLAVTMLARPGLLESVTGTLVVFGIAAGFSAVVLATESWRLRRADRQYSG